MYIPFIFILIAVGFYVVKTNYSAYCARVYLVYKTKEQEKTDKSLEKKVIDSMVFVLSDDPDYRDSIRVMKIASLFRIRPTTHGAERDVINLITSNTKEALIKFGREYPNA